MVSYNVILMLLILFQLKYYICEYICPFKTVNDKFLVQKFINIPLLVHSIYHGLGTFLILIFLFGANILYLALLLSLFDIFMYYIIEYLTIQSTKLWESKRNNANFVGLGKMSLTLVSYLIITIILYVVVSI